MDTIIEHNQALQQYGFFSAADLEVNRQRRFSPSQWKRFDDTRAYKQQSAKKYEQRASPIGSIILVGILLAVLAFDYNGNLKILEEILGSSFQPVMLGALMLAMLFILVIIPLQYRDWVDAYNTKRTILAVSPLRTVHVIEGQAEVFSSDSGDDRQGGHSHRGPHVLQMESVRLLIPPSLSRVIEPKRTYRVYAVLDHGVWVLLSMEAIQASQTDEVQSETPDSRNLPIAGNHAAS